MKTRIQVRTILAIFLIQTTITTHGQNPEDSCLTSTPVCVGAGYSFPLEINTGIAETGPNYGCLNTVNNPTWKFILIDEPGNIEIKVTTSPQRDVDFICWGPFDSPYAPCTGLLTGGSSTPSHYGPGLSSFYPSGNIVDCSNDASWQEWIYLPTAQKGKYYIVMFTNFQNLPAEIQLIQTNSGQSGAGSVNCNPALCNISQVVATPGACDYPTNDFSLNVTVNYTYENPPSNESFIVTDQSTGEVTIVPNPNFNPSPPFSSSTSFTIYGIQSDDEIHSITVGFAHAPFCDYQVTYQAPAHCNNCVVNAGVDRVVCGLKDTLEAIEDMNDVNTHWWPVSGINYYGSGINSPNPIITASSLGTYHIPWTITNSGTVTCSDTLEITFLGIPNPSFSIQSYVCSGDTIPVTYVGPECMIYDWDFDQGYPGIAVGEGPHELVFINEGSGLISQSVQLVVTDEHGCSASYQETINVSPKPSALFTFQGSICNYDLCVLTANSVSAGNVYNWNINPAGFPASITGPGPHGVSFSNTGIVDISLSVYNQATGCTSDTVYTQMHVVPPGVPNCCYSPSPDAGLSKTVCGNSSNLTGSTPGLEELSEWRVFSTPPGGSVIFGGSGINSPTPEIEVNLPGVYVFEWYLERGSCDSSDYVTVTFQIQPDAEAGEKATVCGLNYTLHATPSVVGSNGFWTTLDGNATFSIPNNANSSVQAEDGYGVYGFLWTETVGACTSQDSVFICFQENPVSNAGVDHYSCGLQFDLSADTNYAGFWTSNVNVVYPSGNESPVTTAMAQSMFLLNPIVLIWNTINGYCTDSDTVLISYGFSPSPFAGHDTVVCRKWKLLRATGGGGGNGTWTSSLNEWYDSMGGSPCPTCKDSLEVWVYNPTGNDTVTYVWTEYFGTCPGSDEIRVVYAGVEEPVVFQPVEDTVFCSRVFYDLQAVQPSYGVGFWVDSIPNSIYYPSPMSNHPDSAVVGMGTPGWHSFKWNVVNSICRDTSEGVRVFFVQGGKIQGSVIGTLPETSSVVVSAIGLNTSWPLSTTSLESNQSYSLEVPDGFEYYIFAQNQSPSTNSGIASSYYSTAWNWANALTIDVEDCGTYNADIQLVNFTPAGAGNCHLSGMANYIGGPAADLVDVYLQSDPSGDIKHHVLSDLNGEFDMFNIPIGSYKLYIEIPNLPMITTHYIYVDSGDTLIDNLNFIVDDTPMPVKDYGFGIYADTSSGLSDLQTEFSAFRVYPNPASDYIVVESTEPGNEPVLCTLFDSKGVLLLQRELEPQTSSVLEEIAALMPGVYYVRLTSGNTIYVKKIIRE